MEQARKTNAAGRSLIQQFEGLRLSAYRDTGGKWTIGRGHTRGVRPGMVIDTATADRLFDEDLAAAEFVVRRLVRVPLNENQFSALVSFAYNVPFNDFRTSTLLRLVNEGDFAAAAVQFPRWVYDNGRKISGLERRRAAEQKLFLSVAA